MAGASGFLGTRLVDRLTADGHEVTRLVRRPPRGRRRDDSGTRPPGSSTRPWSPRPTRWSTWPGPGSATSAGTTATSSLIRSQPGGQHRPRSRDAIAGLPAADRPTVLLNSSAVGWYGDTGDRAVEEDAPAGEGFLADVCRVWEAATRPAEDAGVRVVRLRTGLPLHRDGGLLKPQLLPFKLGIGGKLGSGRQWMPWISLGTGSAPRCSCWTARTSPGRSTWSARHPVTNAEFTRELARAAAPAGDHADPGAGPAGRPRRVRPRGAQQPAGAAGGAAPGRLQLHARPTLPSWRCAARSGPHVERRRPGAAAPTC